MKFYPSLISSDILNLSKTISNLDPHVDGYHIDVMDFHFVPNLTWGPQFVNAFTKATQKPLHIHLMVDDPKTWIDVLELRSIDSFFFHIEAVSSLNDAQTVIALLKKKGCKVGCVINPQTPVEKISHLLTSLDKVLVMSVEPGFSGQLFLEQTFEKIEDLCEKRRLLKEHFEIGCDGGVSEKNITHLAQTGVDFVGLASALFSKKNYLQALKILHEKTRI